MHRCWLKPLLLLLAYLPVMLHTVVPHSHGHLGGHSHSHQQIEGCTHTHHSHPVAEEPTPVPPVAAAEPGMHTHSHAPGDVEAHQFSHRVQTRELAQNLPQLALVAWHLALVPPVAQGSAAYPTDDWPPGLPRPPFLWALSLRGPPCV